MPVRETPVEYIVRLCGPLVGGRCRAGFQGADTPLPYIVLQESGVISLETAQGPHPTSRVVQVQIYTETYPENERLRRAVEAALRGGLRLGGLLSAIDAPAVGVTGETAVTHRHILTVQVGE